MKSIIKLFNVFVLLSIFPGQSNLLAEKLIKKDSFVSNYLIFSSSSNEDLALDSEGNDPTSELVYSIAEMNMTFTGATQTILGFNSLPILMQTDTTIILNATATSGLSINYKSSDTSIATISGNIVSVLGLGTVIITAMQMGDTNYLPANSINQILKIRNGSPILYVSPNSILGIDHKQFVQFTVSGKNLIDSVDVWVTKSDSSYYIFEYLSLYRNSTCFLEDIFWGDSSCNSYGLGPNHIKLVSNGKGNLDTTIIYLGINNVVGERVEVIETLSLSGIVNITTTGFLSEKMYFGGEFIYDATGGIKPSSGNVNFIVYPNPTKEKFIIEVPKRSKIEIINSFGLKEKELFIESKLELGLLNEGIYLIKVTEGSVIGYQKLIVK